MVKIVNSTLSIPVRIFLKNPPPPGDLAIIKVVITGNQTYILEIPTKNKTMKAVTATVTIITTANRTIGNDCRERERTAKCLSKINMI